MSESLRVAIVSGEYPPFSIGGIAAFCRDLASNLSKKGLSTTVFTSGSEKISVERANDSLDVYRLPVIHLPPRHLWFPIQNINFLRKKLAEFDVIHYADPRLAGVLEYCANLPNPTVTNSHTCGHCEAMSFLKSPVNSWSVGEFVYHLELPLNTVFERRSLSCSDHVVVCSNVRLNEMRRRNRSLDYAKVTVIYNGIDFDRIAHSRFTSEDDCSLLFWGRMDYRKGIIQLIKAMAIVKEEYPEVSLDVCGKGTLEGEVRSIIRNLGLKDSIRLHGYVDKEFLIRKIQKATVVVLPSLYEGQPIAALEAMAYKKPLIVYDFAFAREYITDWNTGLTAKRGDVGDLAERICVALSDEKLRKRLGHNAYEHVIKYHNWKILVDQYVRIYTSVAS